ncbi:MAG: hypothetical protein NTZ78_00515 [Candidatus Aureabacteria bacterium]|nr:hypothetical protein [Candidatus Auribacterota bacterium]
MDKTIKTYLDRAAEIIGDRTSSEIAHDDAVVEALNQGRTIKEALAIAGEKHPDEAIKWNDSNIGDIAGHYEYLKEHNRIMKMLQK